MRVDTDVENEVENEIDGVCKDHKSSVAVQTAKQGLVTLITPNGKSDDDFVIELRGDKRVRYAELDKLHSLPLVSGKPFHFPFDRGNNSGKYNSQNAKAQVNLSSSLSKTGGAGVQVAVLDTGITFSHPVLKGVALAGANFVSQSLTPKDIADTPASLAVGHGTMVSGVVALIAPKAKILPVRVLNADGTGSTMSIIQGIEYAIQQGAQVINMSFGTNLSSDIMDEVLEEAADKGVILVAAAGNEASDKLLYPASHSATLSVGSVDASNKKSVFSNYNKKLILLAPGENIQSAFSDGAYAGGSGTSFSTPFVSALAALLLSKYPNKPIDWIKDQIRESAKPLDKSNPNYKGKLGRGLIDIQNAMSGNH